MGKKFAQVKRYGLEGAESMMVALDALFQAASKGMSSCSMDQLGCLIKVNGSRRLTAHFLLL
jgi:hypothetical protein